MVQFDAGGMIGRHEAGFGQLFIVLAGTGWVAGDDGAAPRLAPAMSCSSNVESSTQRAAMPV